MDRRGKRMPSGRIVCDLSKVDYWDKLARAVAVAVADADAVGCMAVRTTLLSLYKT